MRSGERTQFCDEWSGSKIGLGSVEEVDSKVVGVDGSFCLKYRSHILVSSIPFVFLRKGIAKYVISIFLVADTRFCG